MFSPLDIAGAFLVTPRTFGDERGMFYESWRENSYAEQMKATGLVQDNFSISSRHVLRGLHYQVGTPQSQLVTIVQGRVVDVLVDLRRGSPTYLKTAAIELDARRPQQVFMPPGVAHGFAALGETNILHYKCSQYYDHATERGVVWNDPDLAIAWPDITPVISARDAAYPELRAIPEADFPVYA